MVTTEFVVLVGEQQSGWARGMGHRSDDAALDDERLTGPWGESKAWVFARPGLGRFTKNPCRPVHVLRDASDSALRMKHVPFYSNLIGRLSPRGSFVHK